MKVKYDTNTVRTSGWKNQPEFDNLLSDLDISSLCFLNDKYKHDIRDFPNHFDLNDNEQQKFYQGMLQRKNMIKEELDNRMMNIYASESYQDREEERFDSNTGLVLDSDYNVLYSIAYDEDENNIIYNHTNNVAIVNDDEDDEDDETDYSYYKSDSISDKYKNWNYQEDLDDK